MNEVAFITVSTLPYQIPLRGYDVIMISNRQPDRHGNLNGRREKTTIVAVTEHGECKGPKECDFWTVPSLALATNVIVVITTWLTSAITLVATTESGTVQKVVETCTTR